MTIKELKEQVFEANMLLPKYHLITFTWGNVSAYDKDSGFIAIKPSGVSYENMKPDDIVIMDLEKHRVDGALKPSSDTDTHIEIYKNFPEIGGIVHTHSHWATIYAQMGRGIPAYGTTHADYLYGEVPCTRPMTPEEIEGPYEKNTGKVIVETYHNRNHLQLPAVLVYNHGPFVWGKSAAMAVHNAVVLEEVAMMAYFTELGTSFSAKPMQSELLDKHFLRKHGDHAYYGQ